ncbi:hypothetical protein HAT86_15710 [Roseovarius gahaiensis]|uniref:Uncharacterized protein n=1 Tax=Roseovarius gahaiensis TaxID=2716691 RepID=A0A967BGR8_9RHOB|nr:hypothetical protein [Roseovarius gahaiensis]NHQ75896.1 hypothetical protein [Roseovarius gahaiensis]
MPKHSAKIYRKAVVNTGNLVHSPSHQGISGFEAEKQRAIPDTGGRKILGLPIASWVSLIAGAVVALAVWFSGG